MSLVQLGRYFAQKEHSHLEIRYALISKMVYNKSFNFYSDLCTTYKRESSIRVMISLYNIMFDMKIPDEKSSQMN